MCGIVGIVSTRDVVPPLLEALKRLEYRGYDSAGIATLVEGKIERRRAEGKIRNLEAVIEQHPFKGKIGIGHTRWATHGRPSEANAHPHATDKVAVVHNGIIENYSILKEELAAQGHVFQSETDTEVIVHQITQYIQEGLLPEEAAVKTLERLHGAFAIAMIFAGHENLMVCARRGSPLAIGVNESETYVGSDALALAPLTQQICYLDEGDYAFIKGVDVKIYDEQHRHVTRPIKVTQHSGAMIGKADYRHFMQKEIYEQPGVVGDVLHSYLDQQAREIRLPLENINLEQASKITIVACGTSYYAGLVAKYWIEQHAKVAVEVDIASEFRYRHPPLPEKGVAIFISQSGETADTLAAMHYAKSHGQQTIAIVNVPESSLARLCDAVIQIHAGPEIGVASTKAFMAQLMVLACFCLYLGQARRALLEEDYAVLMDQLLSLPALIRDVLDLDGALEKISLELSHAKSVLFLGRGTPYALALEGALKLKELSYIHAEAYAAGEMKHGPIALLDETLPIVTIAPSTILFDKTLSNVQEAIARKAQIILMSDQAGQEALQTQGIRRVVLPMVPAFIVPMVYTVPLQLLAYHTALHKGTDVDQPRNLAKSVTVE